MTLTDLLKKFEKKYEKTASIPSYHWRVTKMKMFLRQEITKFIKSLKVK